MQLAGLSASDDTAISHVASTALSADRVSRAKAAYTTRRVDLGKAERILTGEIAPKPGDLVLAEVKQLGQHTKIELTTGRRAMLYVDDEIILAYGARYAPDQFEAYVPDDLGPCDMVAAGGIASECKNKHNRMKAPTEIQPAGLLAYADGSRINLSDWALRKVPEATRDLKVFAVVGTMMNAGKTTCAANLVRGLKRKGLRVGAAKVTGTGSGGDRWALTDAGADIVLDFTDVGEASTFGLSADRTEEIFSDLTNHLAADGVDAIVLEIADGIFQRETASLLDSKLFYSRCDSVLFAAGDAVGAVAGVQYLQKHGVHVAAAGGAMTASPLAVREAKQVLDIPVVTSSDLATGRWLPFTCEASGTIREAIAERPKDLPRGAELGPSLQPINSLDSGSLALSSA